MIAFSFVPFSVHGTPKLYQASVRRPGIQSGTMLDGTKWHKPQPSCTRKEAEAHSKLAWRNGKWVPK